MMKLQLLIYMLIVGTLQAQPPLDEVEKILQEKIKEAAPLMYNGKSDEYVEVFAEDAVIPQIDNLTGKEEIRRLFRSFDMPQTEFTIEFNPITQVDSSYIMSYKIIEDTGFIPHNIEVWKFINGEWKITRLIFVIVEPEGEGGISKQRFFLSSIILGIFLFVFLLIVKKALQWKRK